MKDEEIVNTITDTSYEKFKMGDVITWHPNNFNPDYWNNLPEKERLEYYGNFGYGSKTPKFFVFLTHIYEVDSETGERRNISHSVIVDISSQEVTTMIHPSEFRLVTDREF